MGIGNMITVGSAVAFLQLDTSKYTNGLKVAKREMEIFRDTANDSQTRITSLGNAFSGAGKTLTLGLTTPLVALGTLSSKVAIDLEDAFAGVEKTIDGSKEEMAELRGELDKLAGEIPLAVEEIYGIGEIGGQLGIAREDIADFTDVIAKMGIATNMTTEESATSMARLANIMGTSSDDYDRLGSVIVDLGNNLSTTESEITQMGLRLAGTGNQIGLTESQVLAFGGAMSSVGIQVEAGGSSMSRVWQQINSDVLAGGEGLQGFANIAGVSAREFASAWKDDASQATVMFVDGLRKIKESGGDVSATLKEVGINSSQEIDTLLRLSGASDVLSESLELGSNAWLENNALNKEAETRAKTTASQFQLMKNQVTFLGNAIGSILLPVITTVMGVIGKLVGWVANWHKAFLVIIVVIGALVASIGPLLLGLGFLVKSYQTITGAMEIYRNSTLLTSAVTKSWTVVSGLATKANTGLTLSFIGMTIPIWAVVLAVGAVVVAIVMLRNRFKKNKDDIEKDTDSMTSKMKEFADKMKNPESLFEDYKNLGEEINEGLEEGIESSADKPTNAMSEVSKDLEQELIKTRDKLQKQMEENVRQLDSFGDSIVTALKKKYENMERNQIGHIDKVIDNEKDKSDKVIDIIKDSADQEKDILNRNLDDLKRNTDDRIAEYEREYDEKLRLLNMETSSEVSGLQGKIDEIDRVTALEDKALQEREYNERLSELRKRKASAESSEEKQRIELDIQRHIENRKRRLLLDSRREEKERIRQQIEEVKNAEKEKKDILKNRLDEQKAEAQESLKIETERIQEEIKEVEKSANDKIEIEKQRIKAVIDALNVEKEVVKNHYAQLTEQENLMAQARKMIVRQQNDEIIELLNSYNPMWQNAGQSFSDMLVNGLNSNKQSVAEAVNETINLVPVIERQEVAIDGLNSKIDSVGEKDGDKLPKMNKGLEDMTKSTGNLSEGLKVLDRGLKDNSNTAKETTESVVSMSNEMSKTSSYTMGRLNEDLEKSKKLFKEGMPKIPKSVKEGVDGAGEEMDKLGNAILKGMANGDHMVSLGTYSIKENMRKGFEGVEKEGQNAGESVVKGMIAGMLKWTGRLFRLASQIGVGVAKRTESELEINSPSRRFERIGVYTGEGLIKGLEKSIPGIEKATERMMGVTDVDYSRVSSQRPPIVQNNSVDMSGINKLIELLSRKPNDNNGGGSVQPIILKIGENELARTTIESIKNYEKQTGQIILG